MSQSPLPPNQQLAAPGKWPVVGEKFPRSSEEPWSVTLSGEVEREHTWTLEELQSLPNVEQSIDLHCVTRWSRLGMRFRGVLLETLLQEVTPRTSGRYLSFIARSARNHSTSLVLSEALALGTLIAWEADGHPLEPIHGGPLRVVVPGRYFYKSLKWLERIELLAEDRLGYWEAEAGYHNHADPWREERYIISQLDRQTVQRLLRSRDFRDRDLLSLQAFGMNLSALKAENSLIRNGNFAGANLQRANFSGANLSNACFQQADLRESLFLPTSVRNPDLEGADFRGADLRGARFQNASLFGCTFTATSEFDSAPSAVLDASTQMDSATLATLEATPLQVEFVKRCLELTPG